MEGLVKSRSKRFTEIDCLRGIAIILVVIGHSFFDKTAFILPKKHYIYNSSIFCFNI